jgi:C1A family cysteine protease
MQWIVITALVLACAAQSAQQEPCEQNVSASINFWKVQNPIASFGTTKFSCWSDLERQRLRGSAKLIAQGVQLFEQGKLPHLRRYDPRAIHINKSLPNAVDWRSRGAVTPVKNQGTCGSCWSFSTTGNIEGQWYLAGNPLTSFSEQNFVSCDNLFAFGCDGGFSWIAYSWVVAKQNGSIFTESSYPYVSGNGTVPTCDTNTAEIGGRIIGGKLLSPWDVEGMKNFIAFEGPLSVVVDATSMWDSYTGGIITSCDGILPNHEVLVVGYGQTNSTNDTAIDYWIVKNSWGSDWGEGGFIRIEAGKNLCLIETLANSAEVA